MTSVLVSQDHLSKLCVELGRILEQLERQLNTINQSSAETLTEFKVKNLKQTLDRCEKIVSSLRIHPLLEDWLQKSKIFASRTHLQWGRKIFHAFNGLFALWLYAYSGLSESGFRIVTASFVAAAASLEIVRRLSPGVNKIVCRAMGGLMRERERHGITSATWYMGSILAVLLLFPREVFVLTLLYVAVGDTAAGIVGTKWGRHRLSNHVSLEGSFAAFTSCFLMTLVMTPHGLGTFHLAGWNLFWFSLLGGLIGAVSEAIFKKLDDNLVIPLVAAPSLWGLTHLF